MIDYLDILKDWIKCKPLISKAKESLVEQTIRHLGGPAPSLIPPDEPVLCCILKDGAEYLAHFIRHHRNLGIKHFILTLNQSRDSSARIASGYGQVSLMACDLPFRHFEWEIRRVLVKRYCQNRWVLFLDIDETFDYPFSRKIPLPDLLGYLDRHRFTAVVAQMLDMHPDKPLDQITLPPDPDLDLHYPYYDLAGVEKKAYPKTMKFAYRNRISNPDIMFYSGGLRKTLFDLDCLWLTKHPLFFLDDRLKPLVHPHFSNGAHLADFSTLIRHYPFLPTFERRVSGYYRQGYNHNLNEYRRYIEVIKDQPDLCLKQPTSQRLHRTEDLLEQGFLVASRRFLGWAREFRPFRKHCR